MGRRRAVVEDVTEVRVTFLAQYFYAFHAEAHVGLGRDILFRNWRPEARPSGPRFEFGIGAEQRITAADAPVDPLLVVVHVFPRESPFSPLLSSDLELLRRQ